jgi:hypothetical protein
MYITASRATTMTTAMATIATVEAARITSVLYPSASALKTQGLRTIPGQCGELRFARNWRGVGERQIRVPRRKDEEEPDQAQPDQPDHHLFTARAFVSC